MKAFIIAVVVSAVALSVGANPVLASPQAAAAGNSSAADARIAQRLKADPQLKKYNIKVSVEGNVATLSGTVPTEADRGKAGELAKVNGISRVDNKIVVDLDAGTAGTTGVKGKTKDSSSDTYEKTKQAGEKAGDAAKKGASEAGEAITDTWITTRIKADFVNEDLLKNSDIHVETNDHVVTLSGTVMSAPGRARAVALAKATKGVTSVVDKLTIGPKKS
jgi:hyperosmotically inducible periplasmic protein